MLYLCQIYENDLFDNDLINFKTEFNMWQNLWKYSTPEKPDSAIEALH